MEINIYPENEGVTEEECVFHRPKQQVLCWDNGAQEEMREYGGLQKKGSGDTKFRYFNCKQPIRWKTSTMWLIWEALW